MFEHSENLNPIVVEGVHVYKLFLKKTFNIDVNCKFQDVWAFKMPWAEPIFNEVGLVTSIKCHVYSTIEKKEKVLVVKWDSIEKHASKKKAHDGKWFMDPKCGHAKNEIVHVQLLITIVLQHLCFGQAMENKQKLVQFTSIFTLLSKCKPMIDYEDFQPLFKFLKIQYVPRKDLANKVG